MLYSFLRMCNKILKWKKPQFNLGKEKQKTIRLNSGRGLFACLLPNQNRTSLWSLVEARTCYVSSRNSLSVIDIQTEWRTENVSSKQTLKASSDSSIISEQENNQKWRNSLHTIEGNYPDNIIIANAYISHVDKPTFVKQAGTRHKKTSKSRNNDSGWLQYITVINREILQRKNQYISELNCIIG